MNKQQFYQQALSLGIGNTPLIPYEEDFEADIYVKDESMNASGSIKDRAALAMILAAEEEGILQKGYTIVEASSGNMGISLAYVGVQRGYKVIIAMPENMSVERRTLLQGLGAQLILTESALGMQSAIDLVKQLSSEQPNTVWLNQFQNPANSLVHYLSTADEIAQALPAVDVFVAGFGTSGTLTGTAMRLKELYPQIEIVAVEPAMCATVSRGETGSHAIQGIGAGFVPPLYDKTLVNQIQLVTDDEALDTFVNINKNQGYCCGISSAANIAVCIRLAQNPAYHGKNIVTVFPDGDDRYMSLLSRKM